ncbi:DUF2934 domain-containing protein, partial [Pseudomonas aeruginosa]
MSADEKRIREFAYQIWESEGCPDGQAERHWAMARQLAEAEAAAAAPKKTRGRACLFSPSDTSDDLRLVSISVVAVSVKR